MLTDGQTVTAVLEEKDFTAERKEKYTLDTGNILKVSAGVDKLEKKSDSFTDTLEVSVREVSLSADAGKRTVDVMLGNSAGDTLPMR